MTDTDTLALLEQHPSLEKRASRYGQCAAWFLGAQEIAHTHRNGRLDIRLGKSRIREQLDWLEAQESVTLRPRSEWLELDPAHPQARQVLRRLLSWMLDLESD